jgi:cell division transport system permease protein
MLAEVKDKVDINVYFTLEAEEADILSLQKDLKSLQQVAGVEYISRDQALEDFKVRWQKNALIMQGLEEIGENPFPASLNVKAKDPSQYGSISTFIREQDPKDSSGTPIIDKINYEDNKLVIDRLGSIIPTVEKAGIFISILSVIIAIIVVWNTIRLIIYASRDEISVMKIVGASNFFARGPFVVSGVIYGIVSGLITLVILAVLSYWGDQLILRFAGIDVASNFELIVNVFSAYFMKNFGQIFLLIMSVGIILGGVSSYVAARRYLKV